jgi:hypothetical protein
MTPRYGNSGDIVAEGEGVMQARKRNVSFAPEKTKFTPELPQV